MEFQLNRNNRILEVKMGVMKGSEETMLKFDWLAISPSYISVLEDVLNGRKIPEADTYFMIEEMTLSKEEYDLLTEEKEFGMTASGLTLSGRNIYCFDLCFSKLILDKIGNKKKSGNSMILKNIRIRFCPDGICTAKEASGLADETQEEVNVSVTVGDQVASLSV